MMRVTHESSFDDVEELRKRFEEFRSQHQTRTRLPEELWRAAAEIAGRRGINLVCRCLRLDANSLKKWMGKGVGGFYKTLNGAGVGDLFMSLIHTCELNGANPFDYLTELLRHAEELKRSPSEWMPWNYREALARITKFAAA